MKLRACDYTMLSYLPILSYNAGTWEAASTAIQKLDEIEVGKTSKTPYKPGARPCRITYSNCNV